MTFGLFMCSSIVHVSPLRGQTREICVSCMLIQVYVRVTFAAFVIIWPCYRALLDELDEHKNGDIRLFGAVLNIGNESCSVICLSLLVCHAMSLNIRFFYQRL